MSDPDRSHRLRELFAYAAELPAPERPAFCDANCVGDPELRADLESLLAVCDDPDGLAMFDRSPLAGMISAGVDDGPGRPGVAGLEDGVALATHSACYRLQRRIGEGGMGVVYLAAQVEPVRRRVALKRLLPWLDSKAVLARFGAEQQALARMDHPGIARVLDAGIDDGGQPFFVMEHVDGPPIDEFCERHGLSTRARIELFVELCRAVQHAHDKGVIHRDLKPSNVLVTTANGAARPKVIDFGIAKAIDLRNIERTMFTQRGAIIGTPEYMSPEQANPSEVDVDTRTDVYSLGALLYLLLSGRMPFDSASLRGGGFAEMHRILREVDPPPPSRSATRQRWANGAATTTQHRSRSLRGDLDWITMKALAKDRERRYASADALADDLERSLRHAPIVAGPPNTWYLVRKFVTRYRASVTAAAVVLLALVTGLVLAAWGVVENRAATRQAKVARAREQRTTDPLRTRNLIDRARQPWPTATTLAANRDWITVWLSEADGALARAAGGGTHDDAFAADLTTLGELRADVVGRTAILDRHWPLWEACRQSLDGVEGFDGVRLRPSPGLIPLGVDLDRNTEVGSPIGPLWVFAVGGTGALPRWCDADGAPAAPGAPGVAAIDDDTAVLLVLVPGGTYWRGSQRNDPLAPCYDDTVYPAQLLASELGTTRRTVAPLLIGKHEVTRAQYHRFLLTTGRATWSTLADDGSRPRWPIANIDWSAARAFSNWLLGRLPTEDEWEYCCRAGTTTPYWSGSDDAAMRRVGWGRLDGGTLHAVGVAPTGEPAPNPWGLHDVHGNAFEWCLDLAPPSAGPDAPRLHGGDYYRALRGGSAAFEPAQCRSSARWFEPPGNTDATLNLGVRVCRDPELRS